jgi:prepilin signal peptidase PulO-like enzyme (type II secretory pathway)
MSALDAAATMLLVVLLLLGSAIDARSLRLPDWITLPLVGLGLAYSALSAGWDGASISFSGAAIGFAAFWLMGELYVRRSGREGLGLGDAKLLGAAGAWLGPLALAPVVLIAAVLALLFVGTRREKLAAVPFGPFLSIGFAALWSVNLAGWA